MVRKTLSFLLLLGALSAPAMAEPISANVPADRKMPATDPSAEQTAQWRMEQLNDRFGAKIEF